jgi:peptide/nickel transport system ATP-binding protein
MALLELKDLHTYFETKRGTVKAVNGVSYVVEAGRTLGVVGESGSGKSVAAMSILQLLDGNGRIEKGAIMFKDKNLAKMSYKEISKVRGNDISVIFQEPMTSLNPVFTVKRQIGEAFMAHQGMSKTQAWVECIHLLREVKIPEPEVVANKYPFQLSGGMRQRVMIAMALACKPDLLIADEPTTALDVTIQAQILKLMNDLKREKGTAIMFITHDLGVINEMADDVAVMYCGQVVELAPVRTIFSYSTHSHPYTEGLMLSIPRLDTPAGTKLDSISGQVPHPLDLPKGCKFAPRCKYATQKCLDEDPALYDISESQQIRCFYPSKEERNSEEHRAKEVNHG